MDSDRRVDFILTTLLIALVTTACLRWRAVSPDEDDTPFVAVAGPRSTAPPDADSMLVAMEQTVARNPFRLSRVPALVPYSLRTNSLAPVGSTLPVLVLRGIVGGPPWQAIIDGIPEQPSGTVVRSGSVFGVLEIQTVSRDTVVVRAADSTWRLTLSRNNP